MYKNSSYNQCLKRFASLIILVAIGGCTEDAERVSSADPQPEADPMPEVQKPTVVVLDTSMGAIHIELDEEKAPLTAQNFQDLAASGHYEGLIFHRVIKGFMIQGGGHKEDLSFRDSGRTVVNESSNGLSNAAGTISMARTNDPDSASAQFFINTVDNPGLDWRPGQPGYTVFGHVVEGMDVVKSIESSNVSRISPSFEHLPNPSVVITSARVVGTAPE